MPLACWRTTASTPSSVSWRTVGRARRRAAGAGRRGPGPGGRAPRRPGRARCAGRGGRPPATSPAGAGAPTGCRPRAPARPAQPGSLGCAELVTAPDDGYAAPARRDRVGQEDPGERAVLSGVGWPSRSPASEAAVPLIRWSPVSGLAWKTSPSAQEPGKVAGVPVGEEVPVPAAGDARGVRVGVVDGPADVVVAADVGDPGAGAGGRAAARRARAGPGPCCRWRASTRPAPSGCCGRRGR